KSSLAQARAAIDHAVVGFHDAVLAEIGAVQEARGSGLDAAGAQLRQHEFEHAFDVHAVLESQGLRLEEENEVVSPRGLALPKRANPSLAGFLCRRDGRER